MIAATILAWLVAGPLAFITVCGIVGGLILMAIDGHLPGDLYGLGLIIFALGIISSVPGIMLGLATLLVRGRWDWARNVYIIAIVIVGLYLPLVYSWAELDPIVVVSILVPVVIAAVLMWLPPSRAYFVRDDPWSDQEILRIV